MTATATGIRVFEDDPVPTLTIGPETVEGWTEETRHVEATALVMLLDPNEYEQAIRDATVLLDNPEHMAAAVAILETFVKAGFPQAAKALLKWLGEE